MINKEYKLPCNSTVSIKDIRKTSDLEDGQIYFLPYIDLYYKGEIFDLKGDEIEEINIPIQLRSIDALIDLLKEVKEELLK
jgi:hypothetical protein